MPWGLARTSPVALALVVGVFAGPIRATTYDDAVFHYTFDGTLADDRSNASTAAVYGDVGFTTDRFGAALSAAYFDGVSALGGAGRDRLEFTLPADGSVYAPDLESVLEYTVSVWVNVDPTGEVNHRHYVYETRSPAWPPPVQSKPVMYIDEFGEGAYDAREYLTLPSETHVAGTGFTDDTTWKHLVAVRRQAPGGGMLMDFYLNGAIMETTGPSQFSELVNAAGLWIVGAHHDGQVYQFKGAMDDFAYWDRALSPDEIAGLHEPPAVPEPAGALLRATAGVVAARRAGRASGAAPRGARGASSTS